MSLVKQVWQRKLCPDVNENICDIFVCHINLCHNVRKRTFSYVRQTKDQITLRIRAVCSESSQGPLYVAKDIKRLQADTKTDQTAPVRRMI